MTELTQHVSVHGRVRFRQPQDARNVAAQLLAGNAAVTATTAWRKQQVVYLDAPDWYLVGDGVSVIEKTVAQVGAAFARAA